MTDKDVSGCKREDTMKDYRMPLVISFVLKLKGDEKIGGDGSWSCLSFFHHRYGSMQENGVINEEKWMSVEKDGVGKMASIIYSIFLCFI